MCFYILARTPSLIDRPLLTADKLIVCSNSCYRLNNLSAMLHGVNGMVYIMLMLLYMSLGFAGFSRFQFTCLVPIGVQDMFYQQPLKIKGVPYPMRTVRGVFISPFLGCEPVGG